MDVTVKVTALQEGDALTLSLTNGVAGRDPAPNVPKHLRVTFIYDDQPATVEVAENETLTLPTTVASSMPGEKFG